LPAVDKDKDRPMSASAVDKDKDMDKDRPESAGAVAATVAQVRKRVVMGLTAPSPAAVVPVSPPFAISELNEEVADVMVADVTDVTATMMADVTGVTDDTQTPGKKRGRPVGSKNRLKVADGSADGANSAAHSPQGSAEKAPKPEKVTSTKPERATAKPFRDCGVCEACLDKLKFGGKGVLKQRCIRKVKGTPRKLKRKADDNNSDGSEEDDEPLAKRASIGEGDLKAIPNASTGEQASTAASVKPVKLPALSGLE